jgi:hypothetical protein
MKMKGKLVIATNGSFGMDRFYLMKEEKGARRFWMKGNIELRN